MGIVAYACAGCEQPVLIIPAARTHEPTRARRWWARSFRRNGRYWMLYEPLTPLHVAVTVIAWPLTTLNGFLVTIAVWLG